jgi:hypothetical protein
MGMSSEGDPITPGSIMVDMEVEGLRLLLTLVFSKLINLKAFAYFLVLDSTEACSC